MSQLEGGKNAPAVFGSPVRTEPGDFVEAASQTFVKVPLVTGSWWTPAK